MTAASAQIGQVLITVALTAAQGFTWNLAAVKGTSGRTTETRAFNRWQIPCRAGVEDTRSRL